MATERLCAVADLPEGAARVFEIDDFRLAAARSGTAIFVVEDRCSHDDGELGAGVVTCADDGTVEIECPRHGARFDMANGAQTRMPAVAPIEVFVARVEGADIFVDLPEY
jgi:3-phenylpropionate/trans-cinnamate dioxygenase ferredoxin subunit